MAPPLSPSESTEDASGPHMTRLFQALLRLRRKKGITPSEVAARMGISRQQVYGMETGRSGDPSARTLERYAKAIGARIVVVEKS